MSRVSADYDFKVPLGSASLKFALGSYAVFDDLQSNVVSADSPAALIDAVTNASTEYKKHIELFSRDLVSIRDQGQDIMGDVSSDMEEYLDIEMDMAETIYKLWSLCDICLLHQRINFDILNWLQLSTLELNVQQYIAFFKQMEYPETCKSEGSRLGFYEVIEQLTLQGRLQDAWSILSIHSDTRNSTESEDYESLKYVFHSHPFLHLMRANEEDDMTFNEPCAHSLGQWRSDLRVVRSQQRLVLDSQMQSVFDLLEGNLKTHSQSDSFSCWEQAALATLMFCIDAPLSVSSVLKAVDESLELLSDNVHQMSKAHASIARAILRGEPGPPIRVMCEQAAILSERSLGGASLVTLVSTAHLAQLLHLSLSCNSGGEQNGLEMNIIWPQNEVGLVEELFLQTAERVDAFNAPMEVVVGYCMACPLRGLHFAQVYLVRRETQSDEEVFALCSLLTSLDLTISARVLLSSRGTWWLKQCGNSCKAILFYCMSSDYSRAASIFESAMWDLIIAVTNSGRSKFGCFKDLLVRAPLLDEELRAVPTTESEIMADIASALARASSILEAFETSCSAVGYDKEIFLAELVPITRALLWYSQCIRSFVQGASDDIVKISLQQIARSVGEREIPFRYCLHLIEVIVWIEKRSSLDQFKCSLSRERVEKIIGILHRTSTSRHVNIYSADTSTSTIQKLYHDLLDMLSRGLVQSNGEIATRLRKTKNTQERAKCDDGKLKQTLLDLVLAT